MVGLGIDEASARFRSAHRATLLAVSHAGKTIVNPPADFVLEEGDEALVIATSLGKLRPLRALPA
jgi:voltage-gated potassium channel